MRTRDFGEGGAQGIVATNSFIVVHHRRHNAPRKPNPARLRTNSYAGPALQILTHAIQGAHIGHELPNRLQYSTKTNRKSVENQ